jgi:hypothetical protein
LNSDDPTVGQWRSWVLKEIGGSPARVGIATAAALHATLQGADNTHARVAAQQAACNWSEDTATSGDDFPSPPLDLYNANNPNVVEWWRKWLNLHFPTVSEERINVAMTAITTALQEGFDLDSVMAAGRSTVAPMCPPEVGSPKIDD